MEHKFAGWAKVPSRSGGMKAPKCSCGWKGHAQQASEGMAQFKAHQKGA